MKELAFYHSCIGIMEDLNMRLQDLKKAKMISEMLKNAGKMELCFELAGIEYEEIPPLTWQYAYGLVGWDRKTRKNMAKEIASEIYQIRATLDDADALLIADYKWHQVTNTPYPARIQNIIKKLTITREVNR